MRLATVKDPIQSSGLGDRNNFSIAASAKAFDILSSNLYQNKILAVVREVSCNAADANKSVGKDTSTIQIHVPTFGEPWFSVRDQGPGLSQTDVMQLYTTYFQSTKDNSDDLIGGFGLGSKSPFAVADQFTVTSWHGGFQSEYVMYKDAGLPRVNLIRSVPSNEPTGMLVQVPSTKDFRTWVEEITGFFMWWQAKPTLSIPITFPENPLLGEPKSQTTLPNGLPAWITGKSGKRATAYVGLVPYAIDFSAIPNCKFSGLDNLILPFDVGEVQPNPNRETLSYDPATCANILRRIELMRKEFRSSLEEQINKCPTLYDARVLVKHTWHKSAIDGAINSLLGLNTQFTWNGRAIKGREVIDIDTKTYTYRTTEKRWRLGTWKRNSYERDQISGSISYYGEHESRVYVWSPTTGTKTGYNRKVEEYISANYPQADTINLITGGTDASELTALFEKNGFPPLLDATNWPEPAKIPRTPNKTPLAKAYIFQKDLTFERSIQDVDLTKGGLYLTFHDGYCKQERYPLSIASNLGWLPIYTQIVGFRQTNLDVKKFQTALDNNGWERYDPDTWWATHINPTTMAEDLYAPIIDDHFATSGVSLLSFADAVTTAKTKGKTANLRSEHQFLVRLAELRGKEHRLRYYSYGNLKLSDAQTQAIEDVNKEVANLKLNWDTLVATKPLLPVLNWSMNGLDFSTVIDYLNS